jgi:hypothetical protein
MRAIPLVFPKIVKLMKSIQRYSLSLFFHTDKVLANIAPIQLYLEAGMRLGAVSKWV